MLQDVEDVDDGDDEWLDLEFTYDEESIQSVRCAAHTLQLAVDDALKANDGVKPVIGKVRNLAHFLRTPTNVRQLKTAGKPLPVLDVVTRWGSTYAMLKSVSALRHFFQAVMDMTSKERSENGLTD